MKSITIFDTSIASLNIGDQIIVEAAKREINNLYDSAPLLLSLPTHEIIGKYGININNSSDYSFVLGTNLLTSKYRFFRQNQWNLKFHQIYKLKNIILLGVGWVDYNHDPNMICKHYYNNLLSSKYIHSVRDKYTLDKLKSIGITNVINTGCPTMWSLDVDHCKKIPVKKGDYVVTTLTDYRRDPKSDKYMLEVLKKNYKKVYFWIQGSEDLEYLNSLNIDVEVIPPSLKEFDKLLNSFENLDYIGTRLHAGIRALQKFKRSIIIGVDNRAIEKKKDFNIIVLNREKIYELENLLNSDLITKITLDENAIKTWKSQFTLNEK